MWVQGTKTCQISPHPIHPRVCQIQEKVIEENTMSSIQKPLIGTMGQVECLRRWEPI